MLKDLLEVSRERIRNPFVSSFMIAFVVFNWKAIIFMVFSSFPVHQRIAFTEALYLNWAGYLIWPLFTAGFYTLALPYLMLGMDILLKTANRRKMEGFYHAQGNKLDQQILLAKKEGKLELVKSNSTDIDRAHQQIEELKAVVRQKDESIQTLQSKYHELQISYEKIRNISPENIQNGTGSSISWNGMQKKGVQKVFSEIAFRSEREESAIGHDFINEFNDEIQELIELRLIKMGGNTNNNEINIHLSRAGKVLWEESKREGHLS